MLNACFFSSNRFLEFMSLCIFSLVHIKREDAKKKWFQGLS